MEPGVGFTRRTMSRTGAASSLVWNGGKSSRRHRRRRPSSRNGSPVLLWYRLDQVPQAGALADGDREADIHFPAGGNDSVGVEAAVGPHRELSPGPAVAHPPHRLTQEVGGATGGDGPAIPQPGHQHLASAGGNGQHRVIAAGAGIAVVARSLLGQSIVGLCPCPGRAEATN